MDFKLDAKRAKIFNTEQKLK